MEILQTLSEWFLHWFLSIAVPAFPEKTFIADREKHTNPTIPESVFYQ